MLRCDTEQACLSSYQKRHGQVQGLTAQHTESDGVATQYFFFSSNIVCSSACRAYPCDLLTEATDWQLFPHKLLPTPPTLLSSSPLTPSCLFVRHLCRWKLSTRGRKKSLEDSLKSADYSDHALIPVYGFQCVDDPEAAGLEERRKELCRLEARALAAERTALERRSRAEGGAGGAAFARAMSRRALARADWIQKVPRKYEGRLRQRLYRTRRGQMQGYPLLDSGACVVQVKRGWYDRGTHSYYIMYSKHQTSSNAQGADPGLAS